MSCYHCARGPEGLIYMNFAPQAGQVYAISGGLTYTTDNLDSMLAMSDTKSKIQPNFRHPHPPFPQQPYSERDRFKQILPIVCIQCFVFWKLAVSEYNEVPYLCPAYWLMLTASAHSTDTPQPSLCSLQATCLAVCMNLQTVRSKNKASFPTQ